MEEEEESEDASVPQENVEGEAEEKNLEDPEDSGDLSDADDEDMGTKKAPAKGKGKDKGKGKGKETQKQQGKKQKKRVTPEMKKMSKTVQVWPLEEWVNEGHMYDFMADVAKPVKIVRPWRQQAMKKPVMFVTFATLKDADNAAAHKNKKAMAHAAEPVNVSKAAESRFIGKPEPHQGNTDWLELRNIPVATTEQQMLAFLQDFDPQYVQVLARGESNDDDDDDSNDDARWGAKAFVRFGSAAKAEECAKQLRWTSFQGRTLYLKFVAARREFRRREELLEKSEMLVLSNVHRSVDEAQVRELCAPFGETQAINFWRTKLGFRTGFVSVHFKDAAQAAKAFHGLHLMDVQGKKINAGLTAQSKQRKPSKRANTGKISMLANPFIKKKIGTAGGKGRGRGRGRGRGGGRGRGRGKPRGRTNNNRRLQHKIQNRGRGRGRGAGRGRARKKM